VKLFEGAGDWAVIDNTQQGVSWDDHYIYVKSLK